MIERLEVVSIKVPRTGSESFRQVLLNLYGNDELVRYVQRMDYNPRIYDPNSWYYRDPQPEILFQSELDKFQPYDDRQYLHNHVPYKLVEGLWGYSPFVTFLREPVSWLISCYWFAKQLEHVPQEMGIWDYVELDYRQNWMTMMVDDIKHYDFIGFQETWRDDVMMFIDRFASPFYAIQMAGKQIPTRNVQTSQKYIQFRDGMLKDKMFIRRCKKLHKEDFKLYEEAKNVFTTR